MLKKDSQRQRVYDAENAWFYNAELGGSARFQRFDTNEDCARFVAKVWKRASVQRRITPYIRDRVPRVTAGARNGGAHSWGGRIRLSPLSRRVDILLHEIAHEMTWAYHEPGHNWRYARTMLFLVKTFLGKAEHDALKQHYKNNRVRFRKPHQRVMSPNQRAELAARMAAVRAAKKEKAYTNNLNIGLSHVVTS